jgi:hypothetical protein
VPYDSLIEEQVIAGNRPPIPEQSHPEFTELINSCWHQDPNKRPAFAQVVEQLRDIMAKYCPDYVDYDRDVIAREEALERQRQERNRQYKLQNSINDGDEVPEGDHDERGEAESTTAVSSDQAKPLVPASPKPLRRKRGPSINVVQQAQLCKDATPAARKAMLDQLRQMTRQRDLPHTFSLALPEPDPEPVAVAATATDNTTSVAKSDEASAMMPSDGSGGASAADQAAPPVTLKQPSEVPTPAPAPHGDGGAGGEAAAGAAAVTPEEEAKLKEKEERKRRVEEIRAKMQRPPTTRLATPRAQGSSAPLSPRPTNQ